MKKFLSWLSLILIILGMSGCASHSSASYQKLAQKNYVAGQSSVVTINHNRSTLDPKSWRTDRIRYASLDRLNRTGTGSTAYLAPQNVANDSLRQRQVVYPSGWHQKIINGEPIINRGHLIAYSLSKGINGSGHYRPADQSGDQNNLHNLFTQTAFSNQKVQTIYESRVRTALRNGKRVIFQAQPVFRGNEVMARGVHLQAISTDRSLNFNVYLFNVQPGVKFDYATGDATEDPILKVPTPKGAPHFDDQHSFSKPVIREERWRIRHYRYHPARRGRFPVRHLLQMN